ncbi:BatD [Marinobacterium lacunae]|uniref:BatD n=1 Tax=Marinobacterium lacunae TaxID=1232683 RepID=A0A081FV27_9GAMM|nr:BatD family protein [Marinobacterium lacunae]KEA62382.1 BatD [Marinobacterium lacunae]MBR9885456.1 protein BatD [Oceanospirillales bacterium]
MRRLLAALLLLGTATTAHAEAQATLDRTSITALDNLMLTLEVDSRSEDRPDFTPLHQDFRILGSKRTLISTHSSSGRDIRTRWQVTLRPRNAGNIEIPSLTLAGQATQPLRVDVSEVSPVLGGQPGAQAFFDSRVDSREVYLDGQLLYTARLYHRNPLPNNIRFYPPHAGTSDVRELGERRRHEGEYRGEPYFITEQQYAIFPDQTGPLIIDGPRLELPGTPDMDAVELQGETLEVEVLEPAYQSTTGIWLPAERLTLEESWTPPENLKPGDRFTRELTLTVTGIPAEKLPQLMPANSDDVYMELQDVSLTESASQFGLVSTRRETISIEPLGAGDFILPPIDLHWWDVGLDRGRHAALPTRQFHVNPPPIMDGLISSAQASATSGSDDQILLNTTQYHILIGLLTLLSLTSSLGWLYTWSKLRKFRADDSAVQMEEEIRRQRKLLLANERAERNTFQALAIACQQNSATLAKARLTEWAQNFWPERTIDSLEAICDAARNQTLDYLVLDLEQQLHDNPELWQGDLLLKTIDTLRRRRQNSMVADTAQDGYLQAS